MGEGGQAQIFSGTRHCKMMLIKGDQIQHFKLSLMF